jgi:hypothetical protein
VGRRTRLALEHHRDHAGRGRRPRHPTSPSASAPCAPAAGRCRPSATSSTPRAFPRLAAAPTGDPHRCGRSSARGRIRCLVPRSGR